MWIATIFKHVKTRNENMTKYCEIWANLTCYKVIPWIASSKSRNQKHHGLFKQIWAFAHNVHPAGVLLRKKLLSPALDPNIGSDAPLQRAQSRVLLLSQRPYNMVNPFLGWTNLPSMAFRFSKKATNFETISHLIWRLLSESQIKWEIVSNFCGLFIMSEL